VAAEERLKALDYAGVVAQVQEGLELTAKALLDSMAIDYTIARPGGKKEFLHDVSSRLPEALSKLEPMLEEHEKRSTKLEIARLAAMLRMLTGMKDLARFGIPELKLGAGEIFDYYFAEDLTKALLKVSKSISNHFWYNWDRWKL